MLTPIPVSQHERSPHVDAAFNILEDVLHHSEEILETGSEEIARILHHANMVADTALPILIALEKISQDEDIPEAWLVDTTNTFADVLLGLADAEIRARQRESTTESKKVRVPRHVHTVRTGRPGRPRKVPNLEFLREAMAPGRHIKLTQLADKIGIHRDTLRYYMNDNGITSTFSNISDQDLDLLVRTFRRNNPHIGLGYLHGHLRRLGHKVQRRRVQASVSRVDPLGQLLHGRVPVRRAKYSVPRPNALWHLDGHHKMIRWGIVVHGIVDGYSRTIVALDVNTNNRASTVLETFKDAVEKHGLPSRLRGDRGGENAKVAVYIIIKRGTRRGSFLWGSSTHNTRIERLWVEVGRRFARPWRAFFYRLEARHGLDQRNRHHLWLLHHLFLKDLRRESREFTEEWNHHPVSGSGHNQSPRDMFFMGQAEHGTYVDDSEDEYSDAPEQDLEKYYGTTRGVPRSRQHRSGAGNPPEEDSDGDSEGHSDEEVTDDDTSSEDSGMDESVISEGCGSDADSGRSDTSDAMEDNTLEFHRKPIPVPRHENPFSKGNYRLFKAALRRLVENDQIPPGFGILQNEWGTGGYPSSELLRSGRRGTKELRIELPLHIWKPRAEYWCQALRLMTDILESNMASSDSE